MRFNNFMVSALKLEASVYGIIMSQHQNLKICKKLEGCHLCDQLFS